MDDTHHVENPLSSEDEGPRHSGCVMPNPITPPLGCTIFLLQHIDDIEPEQNLIVCGSERTCVLERLRTFGSEERSINQVRHSLMLLTLKVIPHRCSAPDSVRTAAYESGYQVIPNAAPAHPPL